jgi:SAM-dependent methyltransferase
VECIDVCTATWTNYDNNYFYETVTPAGLAQLAIKSGLDLCCDVELLRPYWENAKSLLEIGAGYGRVIQYLIDNEFKGKITAVERSQAFMKWLRLNFSKVATLKNLDIHDCSQIHDRFDTILFLWSGIADFTLKEQNKIISNLCKLLQPGGRLIFDNVPAEIPPSGWQENKAGSEYTMLYGDGNAKVTIRKLLNEEIDACCRALSLSNVEHFKYITSSGKTRQLHILTK